MRKQRMNQASFYRDKTGQRYNGEKLKQCRKVIYLPICPLFCLLPCGLAHLESFWGAADGRLLRYARTFPAQLHTETDTGQTEVRQRSAERSEVSREVTGQSRGQRTEADAMPGHTPLNCDDQK